jgi:hypothetical protein
LESIWGKSDALMGRLDGGTRVLDWESTVVRRVREEVDHNGEVSVYLS